MCVCMYISISHDYVSTHSNNKDEIITHTGISLQMVRG